MKTIHMHTLETIHAQLVIKLISQPEYKLITAN